MAGLLPALVVEVRNHAPHVEAFAAAIGDSAPASRESECGCRQFDVWRDPADPTVFFHFELYDEAAIPAHARSPHFLAMDSATRDWTAVQTVRRATRIQP